ncbi:MAG: hypothetical protein AAF081_20195, partial [Actinomycetota bacterium]
MDINSASVQGNFSSDGVGVGVPNSGNSDNWGGPSDTNDKVTFTFTVAEPGYYRIKGRVKAPNGADNSFFVTIDGSPSWGWLWDTRTTGNDYKNDWVNDRWGDDPQEIWLDAGPVDVTLHKREDG